MDVEIDKDACQQVRELMGDKWAGLVEVYLNTNGEHVKTILQAYSMGDAKAIVDAAHPMKSASGNMGLMGLSKTAKQIEAVAQEVLEGQKDINDLEEMIVILERQFLEGQAFLSGD